MAFLGRKHLHQHAPALVLPYPSPEKPPQEALLVAQIGEDLNNIPELYVRTIMLCFCQILVDILGNASSVPMLHYPHP